MSNDDFRTASQAQGTSVGRRMAMSQSRKLSHPAGEDEDSDMVPPAPLYSKVEIDNPYAPNDWKYQFLEQLCLFPNIAKACREARVSRVMAYKTKKNDRKFSDLWEEALQACLDQLEQKVFERSMNPWDPGSATLSKFLLQAHRPEVYAPSKVVQHDHEIHTKNDQPVKIQVETVNYRNYLKDIAPPDRPMIEGQIQDISDAELTEDFRELIDGE